MPKKATKQSVETLERIVQGDLIRLTSLERRLTTLENRVSAHGTAPSVASVTVGMTLHDEVSQLRKDLRSLQVKVMGLETGKSIPEVKVETKERAS